MAPAKCSALADLERDADLLERVSTMAQTLQGNPEITAVLVRRWLGEAAGRYGQV